MTRRNAPDKTHIFMPSSTIIREKSRFIWVVSLGNQLGILLRILLQTDKWWK